MPCPNCHSTTNPHLPGPAERKVVNFLEAPSVPQLGPQVRELGAQLINAVHANAAESGNPFVMAVLTHDVGIHVEADHQLCKQQAAAAHKQCEQCNWKDQVNGLPILQTASETCNHNLHQDFTAKSISNTERSSNTNELSHQHNVQHIINVLSSMP
jgi:hypothetical protein